MAEMKLVVSEMSKSETEAIFMWRWNERMADGPFGK